MLLSPTALRALDSIEEIESRILITNFNGNPITTTGCATKKFPSFLRKYKEILIKLFCIVKRKG